MSKIIKFFLISLLVISCGDSSTDLYYVETFSEGKDVIDEVYEEISSEYLECYKTYYSTKFEEMSDIQQTEHIDRMSWYDDRLGLRMQEYIKGNYYVDRKTQTELLNYLDKKYTKLKDIRDKMN